MRKIIDYNNPSNPIFIEADSALEALKKLNKKGKITKAPHGHAYHLNTKDNVYSCVIEGSEEWSGDEAL